MNKLVTLLTVLSLASSSLGFAQATTTEKITGRVSEIKMIRAEIAEANVSLKQAEMTRANGKTFYSVGHTASLVSGIITTASGVGWFFNAMEPTASKFPNARNVFISSALVTLAGLAVENHGKGKVASGEAQKAEVERDLKRLDERLQTVQAAYDELLK